MAGKNPHFGSSFERWLENAGIREEVAAAAIKTVIARQVDGPRTGGITPVRARSTP
jgi:antitoxin HicB